MAPATQPHTYVRAQANSWRAGPLCAIGAPPDALVKEMSASTYPSDGGGAELTVGSLQANGEMYPYAIGWSVIAGKPVVGEVTPAPHPLALLPVDGDSEETAARLRPWKLRGALQLRM